MFFLADLGFRFCLTLWTLILKFLRLSWFCGCSCGDVWCVMMILGMGGCGSWDWLGMHF